MNTFTLMDINWKGMVLRGFLAILLGLIMVLLPGPTLIAVTLLIGVFVLLLGIMSIAIFLSVKERRPGVFLLLQGLVGVLFGIIAIVWPNVTALILILLLGIWCLIEGLFQIYAGLMMATDTGLRVIVGISGVLSIVIGIIFIVVPGDGAIALIWVIGTFAIAYGILNLMFGLLTRSFFLKQRSS
jgi:uncharacterized membrane protein HdeD (DUF308 family)